MAFKELDGDPDRDALAKEDQKLSFPNGLNRLFENKEEFSSFPNLPVGGTTGLCHVSHPRIVEAATWYLGHREQLGRPLIPNLRRMFGLTAVEAVEVLRDADAMRRKAADR